MVMNLPKTIAFAGGVSLIGGVARAAEGGAGSGPLDLTRDPIGYLCLFIFAVAYVFVMLEEFTHLRKSKPTIIAAGLIWLVVGIAYAHAGLRDVALTHIRHNLLDYAELMLFLLTAMTYVNVFEERGIFDVLRAWLARSGLGYRQLFWLTGALAFVLSPIFDNLTAVLILGAIVVAIGRRSSTFMQLACINVVVSANAGGAFSPFGDITTLMVWQRGHLAFFEFFAIFVPSLIAFLVPAALMHFAVPTGKAETADDMPSLKPGAVRVMVLFGATVAIAIGFNSYLGLPPVFGMMLGLGLLQLFGFYLQRRSIASNDDVMALDVHTQTARAEWDTLLFFYGVIMSVGGLSLIGYLGTLSNALYGHLGPTIANTSIGALSAIFDNIPLMFAVLTMEPQMSQGQWLLITLTTGVGGSLLSVGSAAGVALMGVARGHYTFFSHLKWSWAIAIGSALAVAAHLVLNRHLF